MMQGKRKMGLKVTMEHGQSVKMGEIVLTNRGKRAVIEVDAPDSVKIDRQYQYSGQKLTVEQQQKMALAKINRGK